MSVSYKNIILIIFICFSIKTFSQDNLKDLQDSIKGNLYNNPRKSIKLLHQYTKLVEETNNTEVLIPINATLAAAHEVMYELDSAFYYHHKNLSISKKPIDVINTKRNIARILIEEGKYRESLRLYYQVLELTKENNEKEIGNAVKVNIASLKNKISKPNEAIQIIEDEYKRLKQINNKDLNLRFTRKLLIEAYVENKNYADALLLIDEGIDDSKDINDCEFLYHMHFLRSEIRIINNEFILAKVDCKKALECANKLKNNEFINEIKFRNAKIAFLNKNFEEALNNLNFIHESNIPKSTVQLTKYYNLTSDVYKKLENKELSTKYYYSYLKEQQKLFYNKLATFETLYNLDKDKGKLEQKKQTKTRWIWTGISAILLLLIIILYFIFKNKSKTNQKRFDDLMLKVNTFEKEKIQESKPNSSTETVESIINPEILEKKPIENTIKKEDSTYVIKDKKIQEILQKIQNLEDKMYFLRHDCTLHNMAKKLKTNTTYLSKIINTHLNKSFSNYIAELRINHAIIEIKNNKRLRSYSVKGIAEEMGYKNPDIFSKYFKEATGITPVIFIKKITEFQK